MECCDVICTACGRSNSDHFPYGTSAYGSDDKWRVVKAIQKHSQQVDEYLQRKNQLKDLLREAAEQGTGPGEFRAMAALQGALSLRKKNSR